MISSERLNDGSKRLNDEKADTVEAMFGRLASGYDAANDLISIGQHRRWKARAVAAARAPAGGAALDLCTGTGDLAMLLARSIGPAGSVTGIDFCAPMLQIAARRTEGMDRASTAPITLIRARAEQIPLTDDSLDVCTVAFGLRNVSDLSAALSELCRVLRPGGKLVSLDVSTPDSAWFGPAYAWYFERVLPLLGAVVNRSLSDYRYLPRSAVTFPQRRDMCRLMIDAGFASAGYQPMSGGAVAIHIAEKGS